jgi:type II secretion system protein J
LSFKFQVSSFKFQVWNSKSRVRGLGFENSGYWFLTTDSCSRGFTLLEVLVATTILGLVLAALYSVFSRTLESKRLAEERTARARAARIVLFRLREELQSSVPFAGGDSRFFGELRRSGAFPEGEISFVSLAQASLGSTGPESDLNEIGYTLLPEPEAPGYRQLVRRVKLDPGVAVGGLGQNKKVYHLLLSRVRGLRFRFFDGRTWREEWGQDDTRGKLPRAVEATLYLDGSGEQVAEFSTVVDLPLATGGYAGTP